MPFRPPGGRPRIIRQDTGCGKPQPVSPGSIVGAVVVAVVVVAVVV
ncbi:MAG: hypothetical protein RLZZ413_2406, partial [Pseudomonadota bacterium]